MRPTRSLPRDAAITLIVCSILSACGASPAPEAVAPAPEPEPVVSATPPPAAPTSPPVAPEKAPEDTRVEAPPSPSVEEKAPSGVPGANLTVASITVDGVVIENLSCKMDGLGLLGAMLVAGTVAKQRNALRACGVTAPVPVSWTLQGGAVKEATATTGDAKRDGCVVRAMKHVLGTSSGACQAKIGLK